MARRTEAPRSGNPSVIAVTTQFVVDIEKTVMVAAIAAQPISGFPLGWAIGLSLLNEFWIAVSLVIYAVTVACWIAAFRIETRLRSLSRQAALNVAPLPEGYRRLFGAWSAFAATVLLALTFLHERLGRVQWIGLGLAFVAIYLLSA